MVPSKKGNAAHITCSFVSPFDTKVTRGSSSAADAFFPAAARIPAKTMYPWRARVSTVRRPKPLVLPVTRIVCAIGMLPFSSQINESIYSHSGKKLANCLLQVGEQRHERPKLLFTYVKALQGRGTLCLKMRYSAFKLVPGDWRRASDTCCIFAKSSRRTSARESVPTNSSGV